MGPCTSGNRWGTLRNAASSGAHVNEGVIDQNQFIEVELVGEPLAFGLMKDSLVVVVSQGPAELIIVHLGFTLPGPPEPGHFIWILNYKFTIIPLPGDDIMILLFPEQFQDEVPQLDLPGPGARLGLVSPFWEGEPSVSRCFHSFCFSQTGRAAGC